MSRVSRLLIFTAILVAFSIPASSQTILSADNVYYQSEGSDFFDGPVLVATVSSNHEGDVIEFNTGNRDVTDLVPGATNDTLEVEVSSQDIYAEYSFKPGKTAVSQYNITSFDVTVEDGTNVEQEVSNMDKVQDVCYDISGNGDIDSNDYLLDNIFLDLDGKEVTCIAQDNFYGNVGTINTPSEHYVTTWEVRNGNGRVERATLSNSEIGKGNQARIGPDVQITFTGGEKVGLLPPIASNEFILHSNDGLESTDGFRVISEGNYDDYTDEVNKLDQALAEYEQIEEEDGYVQNPQSLVQDVNLEAEEAYQGVTNSELSGMEFSTVNETLAGGTGRIYEDNLFYPQFTVEARACRNLDLEECDAFINVQKEVGIAEITDVSTRQFGELDQVEVNLTYKNVGYQEGSFSARIKECSGEFSPVGVPENQNLEKGESFTEQLYVTGSSTDMSDGTVTGECVAEVQETGSLQKDEQRFTVSFEQLTECTYYDSLGYGQQESKKEAKMVNGEQQLVDVIYECQENELGYEEKITCDPDKEAKRDQTADGIRLECVEEDETPGGNDDNNGDDSDCKVTLVNNPAGNNLTVTNPVCAAQNWLDSVFGGIYGNFTLIASTLLGLFGFGLRGRIARLMSIATAKQVNIFGRNIAAEYVLGLALFVVGFVIGINIMTNPVFKWGMIILTVLAAFTRLVIDGPIGLVDWLLPDARR